MKTHTTRSYFAILLSFMLLMTLFTACSRSKNESADSETTEISVEEQKSVRSKAAQEKLDQDVEKGYLILVNKDKDNHLSQTYKPDDLKHVKYFASDRLEEGRYLREEASQQFQKLVEDAAKENIDIVVTTAYRSYSFQSTLFNNYVAQKGEAEANKTSARPGESEHQTGLAADLSTKEINYRNSSDFGNTAAGKWIAKNCYKYGFIIRYPEGMEGITGYTYEPWHIRYVGKTAAEEIYDEDITLEEYLEENDLGNSIPKSADSGTEGKSSTANK